MSSEENKPRTYDNLVNLTNAEIKLAGNFKIMNLRFVTWNKTEKKHVNKFFRMFLTEENNDRNRATLQLLGVENPPEVISAETTLKDLPGLGYRTVDLVNEVNDAGYENVKYINEPRYGIKVWDNREQ